MFPIFNHLYINTQNIVAVFVVFFFVAFFLSLLINKGYLGNRAKVILTRFMALPLWAQLLILLILNYLLFTILSLCGIHFDFIVL